MELRPFQDMLIEKTRAHIRQRVRRILVQLATGGGKTVIAAFMIQGAWSRGLRVWFVVHRKELLKQTSATFAGMGIAHAFIAADWPENGHELVQLCGIDTLAIRLDRLAPPDIIVWDEAHHCVAATYARVSAQYPDAVHIGLSATPTDLAGRGLDKHFDVMVNGPSTADLIEMEYLSPFDYFGPGVPDLAGVVKAERTMSTAMQKPKLIGDAIEHYQRLAPGEQGIVFAVNREHSRKLADAFTAEGIPAWHVDGTMSTRERDRFDDAFRAGDVRIGVNVDLFGEGYDVPGISYLGMMRRTDSLRLFLQWAGRVLRISAGKTRAVIADHAGNWTVHGQPDDERTWSLEGVAKKAGTGNADAAPIRQCPECFRIARATVKICPGCGHEHGTVWTPPEWEEGKLFQIKGGAAAEREAAKKAAAALRKAEERECKDLADFIRLGTKRGYEKPLGWAKHQIEMRQGYAARFRRRA